jgi:hypothetical protein
MDKFEQMMKDEKRAIACRVENGYGEIQKHR